MSLELTGSIGVQSAMEEMDKLEQKGDVPPEELEALAQEVSSKMLLTTWRMTRWEVIGVRMTKIDFSADLITGRWRCSRPSPV